MALGGVYEKANPNVHRARNILEYSRRSCGYSTYCTSILKARIIRFWKVDPSLKRISLIEDDILSNPRQIQAKVINQLGYTVYTLYYKLLETSSDVLCTHSTANLLPLGETASPP